jgi:hypothetical protein
MATKQDVVEVGCGYSGSATPRSSSPAFRRGHGFIWAGAWWGGLMPEQPPEPNGLFYQPDFITQAEEQQVLDVLQALEFHPSPCPAEPPNGPCAISAWTTAMSPGSWCRPTRCRTSSAGCRSVPRHWPG